MMRGRRGIFIEAAVSADSIGIMERLGEEMADWSDSAESWLDTIDGPEGSYMLEHVLSEEDLCILTELLKTAASQWKTIGDKLGFLPGELDTIANNPSLTIQGSEGCFRELLIRWLKWAPVPPTNHPWPTIGLLVTALGAAGEEKLAFGLPLKYLEKKGAGSSTPETSSRGLAGSMVSPVAHVPRKDSNEHKFLIPVSQLPLFDGNSAQCVFSHPGPAVTAMRGLAHPRRPVVIMEEPKLSQQPFDSSTYGRSESDDLSLRPHAKPQAECGYSRKECHQEVKHLREYTAAHRKDDPNIQEWTENLETLMSMATKLMVQGTQMKSSYENQVTCLEYKIESVEHEIQTASKDAELYQREVDLLKSEHSTKEERLQAQLKAAEEEKKELDTTIITLSKRLSKMEEEKFSLRQQLEEAEDRKRELGTRASTISRRLWKTEEEKSFLQQQLEEAQEERRALFKKHQSEQRQIKQELEKTQAELLEKEVKVCEIEQANKTLEEEKKQLQEELAKAKPQDEPKPKETATKLEVPVQLCHPQCKLHHVHHQVQRIICSLLQCNDKAVRESARRLKKILGGADRRSSW